MEHYYSGYRNVQMLIQLMKAHNVRNVIISPGTTHISLIGSLQNDGYFNLYSVVDERNACYMACGMALESGEPVAITCTEATAPRNYISGLTEAYHKKLPILVITGARDSRDDGNLIPQHLEQTIPTKGTVLLSVSLQRIKDEEDERDCNLKINRALLELRHRGGGPVHINLITDNTHGMMIKDMKPTRVIRRYCPGDDFPDMSPNLKIAVSVGSHMPWTEKLTETVDRFCAVYNAVVLVDHSSGYHGHYRILPTISTSQEFYRSALYDVDLLIHIGEYTGDYYTFNRLFGAKEVWRVSEDGELRDTFKRLTKIFEMREMDFFAYYTKNDASVSDEYWKACKEEQEALYSCIPDLPLSNIWLAKTMSPRVPDNAAVHFGVSNTMRSWTFFEMPESVYTAANVGGRGIDGAISAAMGMALTQPDRIHYCILGDLTFFYNMNTLCDRNVRNNLRILLINNDGGTEFHLHTHTGYQQLGEDVGMYVAADGHNGRKSRTLVKNYVESLGFLYLGAWTKEEVMDCLDTFLNPVSLEQPMLMEVFTRHEDENIALRMILGLQKDNVLAIKSNLKKKVKEVIGEKGVSMVKKVIRK